MAYTTEGLILPFIAGGTIAAGNVVMQHSTADQVVVTSAATSVPLGVAVNDAASGGQVRVQVTGVAKVLTSSAAITLGAKVQGTTAGAGIAAATTGHPIGVALAANGSAAVYIPVSLNITLTPLA